MISKKLLYLKLIINTLYWKNYFSYTETAESVFSTYGFFWAVTEITENFTPYTIKPFINSNWSLVLSIGIIVGFFISVYKTLPKTEAHYKFRNAEIFAGFMINDFFKIQGDKVISFNTDAHIKTHNENGFISEKSIQGQWRKAISIDLTNTETLVSKSINDEGYTLPMQVGSVITLKNDGVNYYLLTLTNLSQTGHVVNSNFTDIQNSLYSLWQYLH
ncbi:MAG: DUF6430 domain-containing protein, partial [Bacteriovoracaceae bacterium]|nr:DUF6430 domain-containing protein [Bacteriovoracaceae bacterium]